MRVEKTTNKIEREWRRVQAKVRWFMGWPLTVIMIIGGFALGVGVFSLINAWYDAHKVTMQNPVVFRPPVIVSAREVLPVVKEVKQASPVTTEANLPIINELYRKIRYAESNAGMSKKDPDDLHNYCQRMGKVNEIGWIPVRGEKYCFEDEGVQWSVFKGVFISRLKKMGVREALCVHNIGVKTAECPFANTIVNMQ